MLCWSLTESLGGIVIGGPETERLRARDLVCQGQDRDADESLAVVQICALGCCRAPIVPDDDCAAYARGQAFEIHNLRYGVCLRLVVVPTWVSWLGRAAESRCR